jgi:hypothetical protein
MGLTGLIVPGCVSGKNKDKTNFWDMPDKMNRGVITNLVMMASVKSTMK